MFRDTYTENIKENTTRDYQNDGLFALLSDYEAICF